MSRMMASSILVAGSLLLAGTTLAQMSDPMRPSTFIDMGNVLSRADVLQSGWVLQSTMIAPQRTIAVINDQAHSVGDTIGGARITRIGPGVVEMEENSKRFTITLVPALGKIPSVRKETTP
ncbi:MAG: hypothetical protein BMS9Abin15_1028 [Gammaproteobacteria bacterium]|nr:MAG: hypothetical protein BMS9Abin15_1028 [Gammaproteobacteria bacterium]